MDYEKAYKEARQRMKDIVVVPETEQGLQLLKETVFPELAESEDERIRKELIKFISDVKRISENGRETWAVRKSDADMCAAFLSYLEKQKEQKPKQKPKWLYRLEFKDKSCGLWYNGKGEWCFESGIGSLDDSCKTKTLPMDYDERYKADGRDWFSSCSRKEDLLHWYSKEDARILLRKGFVFTRYLATEYTEYEEQTVFIKETALYREEIDFFSLFDEQKPAEWSEVDQRILANVEWLINESDWPREDKDVHLSLLNSLHPVKQEWSEEDKAFLKVAIAICNRYSHKDIADWLKSLHQRFSLSSWGEEIRDAFFGVERNWKPSEKQIGTLLNAEYLARANNYPENAKILANLYEQLKAL